MKSGFLVVLFLVGQSGASQPAPTVSQVRRILLHEHQGEHSERQWFICNERKVEVSDTIWIQSTIFESFCCARTVWTISRGRKISAHQAFHCQEPPLNVSSPPQTDLHLRVKKRNGAPTIIMRDGQNVVREYSVLDWERMIGMQGEPMFDRFKLVMNR